MLRLGLGELGLESWLLQGLGLEGLGSSSPMIPALGTGTGQAMIPAQLYCKVELESWDWAWDRD
jgi:hypothetical protein